MKVEDVIVNFVAFITFSRLSHPGITSTLFSQPKEPTLQEMMVN